MEWRGNTRKWEEIRGNVCKREKCERESCEHLSELIFTVNFNLKLIGKCILCKNVTYKQVNLKKYDMCFRSLKIFYLHTMRRVLRDSHAAARLPTKHIFIHRFINIIQ